jgi:hypothetical protein
MCEPANERQSIANVPCKICVVENCERRDGNVFGCSFGKPSNDMIKWAFEYTNALRYAGVKKPF